MKAELNQDHYAEIHALKEENDELSSDNEKHRDDLIKCRDDILHLQEQLKQLQFQNEGLLEEKTQLEDQISSHKSLLETQRTSLAAAEKSREGAKRQKNDDSRNLHRLELENQRLRVIVVELEENNEIRKWNPRRNTSTQFLSPFLKIVLILWLILAQLSTK